MENLQNAFINTLASKLGHKPTELEIQLAWETGVEYYCCAESKLVDIEDALDNYIKNNYVETEFGNKIFEQDAIKVDDKYFESESEIYDYCLDCGCKYDSDAGHFVEQ